jgi:mono/diheme cytochrome c family protein
MRAIFVVAGTLLAVSGAAAQDADIQAGAAYAAEVCATCHAVGADDLASPVPEATPFQTVADTPGMTEMALTVWLQSSHPTMPNIILTQDETRNVVAYIRSLESE